jgi:N-acetyl-beta-hexosaminidase
VQFIDKDLAEKRVNLLVLTVEYNFRFKSHPELSDSLALSLQDVKKIVNVCRKHKIRIVPLVDMLGHQSWANHPNKLLRVYPQFDETPYIKMPEKYEWPNADNLYCKSYCPLHPDLHPILFSVVDEICDAFEANAFHVGMDEVFILGDDKCERCSGRDKAELFADEVSLFRNHLAGKGRELFIWGDRLLDGKTTGLGIWEASYNNTYRAIDLIPKDVIICDWHYERADKTAVIFAMKGLRVITCPWRTPQLAITQVNDMVNFRKQSSPEMKDRFLGVMETTWSRTDTFLNEYYKGSTGEAANENTSWNCFRVMFNTILKLE